MAGSIDDGLQFIKRFNNPYLKAARLGTQGQTWGIDSLHPVLAKLGDPQHAYPVIHIAGTKGKGSTAAFTTYALMAAGYKVGLYTTPHLQEWNERIQINRQPIPLSRLTELVRYMVAVGALDPAHTNLTEYEIATAAAFLYFAQEQCDIAVIEVGLGGTLDATNVVDPLVSVITRISYDHMQFLGGTLTEIATNKAGIIKPSRPVVSAMQNSEALRVLETTAHKQGSPFKLVEKDWLYKPIGGVVDRLRVLIGQSPETFDMFELGLSGLFQFENATLALAALHEVQAQGFEVGIEAIQKGFSATRWKGRFEVIQDKPLTILDGAHNVDSIEQLMVSLDVLTAIPYDHRTVIFGCMGDKDIEGILKVLMQYAKSIILTEFDHIRAASAKDLFQIAHKQQGTTFGEPTTVIVKPDLRDAFVTAFENIQPLDLLLATGSLALVGSVHDFWER